MASGLLFTMAGIKSLSGVGAGGGALLVFTSLYMFTVISMSF